MAPESNQVPAPDLARLITPLPLLAMIPLIVLDAVLVPLRVSVRDVAVLAATPFKILSAAVLSLSHNPQLGLRMSSASADNCAV